MQLHYLLFDFSDEESGHGSFDAMASVAAERRAALLPEIESVLRWARQNFGPAGASHDEGEWRFDLQGVVEPDTPLRLALDERSGQVRLDPEPAHAARITLTLTLSGSSAFCEALAAAFDLHA